MGVLTLWRGTFGRHALRSATMPCLAVIALAMSVEAAAARAVTAATVQHAGSSGEFTSVAMGDAGEDGDATAGDGVFTARVSAYGDDLPRYLFTYTLPAAEQSDDEVDAGTTPTTLVINELMASNGGTIEDPQGDDDDWIELLNWGTDAIDLSGMYLSDKAANPLKWQFPEGTAIAAGGYLLVWADDDSGDSPGLHTNFKLSAGGESVVLSDIDARDNVVIDSVDFPALATDVSYGRSPEATGAFSVRAVASPGRATPVVPEIAIAADGPVTEGGTATLTISAAPPPSGDLAVGVQVTQGRDQDYLPASPPTSVTVPAGASEALLGIQIPNDTVDEPNGLLTVTLTSGPGYVVASPASASLIVRDDDASPAAAAVVINELMASNGSTVADPQGEYDDWIELFNTTASAIDLSGMYLSDRRDRPKKWQFPEGTSIGADGRLLVWADDDSGDSPGLHANFKLSAGGESVVLSDTEDNGNAVIDAVDFPELARDEAYARTPEGTGSFRVTRGGSPGTAPPPSSDATLSGLSLTDVDIGSFDPATAAYTADVRHPVDSTTVTATASDADAEVTITPADADAGTTGHQITLIQGSNEISIVVTDDETVRTYVVTVVRAFPPLTAGFDVLPASHSGVPFTLRVRFSEPVTTGYRTMRDDSFEVTHGEVALANRVDGRSDLWNVVIDPTAAQDIVVTLPAATDCAAAGAVCTADGRGLSHSLVGTVTAGADARVPVVSVSSASETLVEGDRIAFTVSRTGIKAFGTLTANLELTVTGGEERYRSHTVNLGHRREALLLLGLTDDRVVREAVTVVRTVLAGEGYGVSVDAGTAQTVLADNDVAEFAVTAPSQVAEGASAAIHVSTTNGVTFGEDQTIALTASGSATAGEDYRLPSETVLAAETTTASLTLEALQDGVEEEAETVTVTAFHAGTAIGSVSLSIDAAVELPLTAAFENVPDAHDGETEFTFDVRFSEEVKISYVTLRDASFEVTNGVVRKAERLSPPSNIAWRITVEPTAEGDITITLPARSDCSAAGAVCTAGGAALSNRATVTVVGPQPAVSITAAAAQVTEGTAAEFTLTLGGAAASSLTLSVSVTEDGSMLSGAPPESVSIAAGETAATLSVATADDALVEADSVVTATLTAGTGYTLGEASSATVTVENDDDASFSVSAAPSEIAEGGVSTVTVSITNDARFADERTIALAVSGTASVSDYELAPSLTLAAGSSTATAMLTATDDTEEEQAETVTVTASVVGEAAGSATVTIRDVSDDASLAALELSDVEIGTFDAEVTAYTAEAPHGIESTTVQATPTDANASVELTDAVGSTLGTERTSTLTEGANEITAQVTAEDGVTRRTYAVTVTRAAVPAWGARLPGRDITLADAGAPSGVWSDGETVWVTDRYEVVRAYALSDGRRLSDRDLDVGSDSIQTALWSDGETLWVGDYYGGVLAHRLSDGARLASRDLDAQTLTVAGNDRPTGLWSDGETLWVADNEDAHVYAYGVSGGARAEGQEFGLRKGDVKTGWPWGVWSDGDTALASWYRRGKVYAYRLSDGARQRDRDIDTGSSGNGDPQGLWSDGETLWVLDGTDRKLYAYGVPGLRRVGGVLPELLLTNRAEGVPGTDPGASVSIPDPGLRGRIGAALGKAPWEPIGVHELASLTVLDARDAGVQDLTGLEQAVNLEGIDLGLNAIADLRPLGSLPLKSLNLDGAVSDPWALSELTGLRRLSVRGNDLSNVEALSSLTGLEVLDLGNNRIADLGPVVRLTELRTLRLDGNAVADLSPLSGLGELTMLDLRDNTIEDVSALAGLRTLVEVGLLGNRITDFSTLADNEGLRVIGRTGQRTLSRDL